jgi:DNA-binding GntR family transcriptional regulator
VSRLTARKAVRVLADEGLVEVVTGRGAYVRES